MPSTQRASIGRSDTAPTAAQRIVATMWTLGKPATISEIAKAADVGYSTATPILRNLLKTEQVVKTDPATGPAEWQLTATLSSPHPTNGATQAPQPPYDNPESASPAPATETSQPSDAAADADQPDNTDPGDTPDPDDTADADTAAEPGADAPSESDDDTDDDATPVTPAAGDGATPTASPDAEQELTGRTYRKPVQPRRPKGELRAAVLAVLTGSPEQPFKVSEVCKAIDAANTDGAANKAGAGAVANALDKLVTSGDAARVEEAKYATYQAAAPAADPRP
jgi:hypothetical protein